MPCTSPIPVGCFLPPRKELWVQAITGLELDASGTFSIVSPAPGLSDGITWPSKTFAEKAAVSRTIPAYENR